MDDFFPLDEQEIAEYEEERNGGTITVPTFLSTPVIKLSEIKARRFYIVDRAPIEPMPVDVTYDYWHYED